MEIKNILIYIGLPVVLLLIALILFFGFKPQPVRNVEIVFWGLDNSEVFEEIIRSFEANHPVKVRYVQKPPQNYERELLSAMAAGSGPDVFVIHHTWLPRFQDKLSPIPDQLMPLKKYYDTFVDVATQDFVADGNIWAVPLYIDSLALFWNKDIFNTVGIPEPPKNWNELLEDVNRVTIKDDDGNIVRAGAAIGTALNINHSTDILSLLMLQTGAKMVSDDKREASFHQSVMLAGNSYNPGEDSLRFYTDFANPQTKSHTWSSRLGNSLDLFSQGKVAMIFEYSSAIEEIKRKSPYLNFSIAPLPQTKDASVAVNYADYWGPSVWSGSKKKNEAWTFVLWLAEKEQMQKYAYLAKKPVSRRDLINWQKDDPFLGVFASQSLSARSWYQVDDLAIKEIFSQMIESVVLGQNTPTDAVARAANQLTLLMRERTNENSYPSSSFGE